jgi:hypothetical protein
VEEELTCEIQWDTSRCCLSAWCLSDYMHCVGTGQGSAPGTKIPVSHGTVSEAPILLIHQDAY